MKQKITVIGAGNMGTALAQLIATNGHQVTLWNYDPKILKKIAKSGRSPFLPGIDLSTRIKPEEDLALAVQHAEVLVLAVSSPYVRRMAAEVAVHLSKKAIVVCVAKAIEVSTGLTMVGVTAQELSEQNRKRIVELSGPSLADEFARGVPTAVVLASKNKKIAQNIQTILESKSFKVDISTDVRGVALCGALKNAYSIALGLCDGLGYGMNAKALMATAALGEMEKLVLASGGKPASVHGLAGHGDLMVTAFGKSRNRDFGMKLSRCRNCKSLIRQTEKTTEGLGASRAAFELAKKHGLNLPLLEAVYKIIHKNQQPKKTVEKYFFHVSFE